MMVRGWFSEDIEVSEHTKTGDALRFGVKFLVGEDRRYFDLAITESAQATWLRETPVDLEVVKKLATGLLANGAAEMPHRGYLFTSDPTLRSCDQAVAEMANGIDRFAWPGS